MHDFRLIATTAFLAGTAAVSAAADHAPGALRPEKAPGVVTGVSGALVIEAPAHAEFPDAYQFSTVEHVFRVVHRGDEPVLIERAVAVGAPAEVEVSSRELPPGGSARVTVRQPLDSSLGMTSFRYALITDEPGVSRYRFSLSGFVQSAFDPERPMLDFGRVDAKRGGEATVEIGCREVDRLELRPASSPPGILALAQERAGLHDEAVLLRAALAEGVEPRGLIGGTLLLATNVPHQSLLEIAYRAEVFGDVVPSVHPVDLGLTRVGERTARTVRLRSRTGTPFAVRSVEDPSEAVVVVFYPCGEEAPSPCWDVVLEVAGLEAQPLGGSVLVRFEGEERPLPLSYRGLVVSQDTRIRRLTPPDGDEGGVR